MATKEEKQPLLNHACAIVENHHHPSITQKQQKRPSYHTLPSSSRASSSSSKSFPTLPPQYQEEDQENRRPDDKKSLKLSNTTFVDPDRNLTWITICLCVGACLPSLDVSIVFTIMNEIGTEFHRAHLATWLHTSYAMSCLATLPLAGKLSDVFGRKYIMLLLVALFFIGSVGCGAATSMNQILISRVLAGFGGGGLQLMSNVVIQDLVPSHQRGQYQSYVSSVQTLGIALGSPLGGFITDTLGWRYAFKLNIIPLICISYYYTFHFTNYNMIDISREGQQQKTLLWKKLKSIDFMGAFLLGLANLSFATTVLLGGNTRTWTDPLIITAIITTFVSFFLFILQQTYWASNPLVSRSCIVNRNVICSSLAYFFICMSNGSVDFTIPQFFMGVLGFTTSQSGMWTMMNALAVPIGCYCAGHYIRYHQGRFQKWLLVSTSSYTGAILVMSCWMVSMIPFIMGIACMPILGFSYGSTLVSLLVAVTADVPSSDVASAMSVMMLFRSMGFLYGTAISSSIIQGNLKTLLEAKINGPSAEYLIHFIRTSIRQVHTLSPQLQQLVADVLGQSLQRAYIFMAFSCAIAILPIVYLKDMNHQKRTGGGSSSSS
ncbi:major facilitator superfamily domain-containing protein [Phascolomyces articulosus]|uniref:Major facilitator superfamily domain-containing protein n=1 Tax=Phascolomyces articulosus TaxID=60185 RepID=A0AAD5PEM2_9FUNG|nr:major facilitator superfamily domain-containing protein [Phascolomyces articulosus]